MEKKLSIKILHVVGGFVLAVLVGFGVGAFSNNHMILLKGNSLDIRSSESKLGKAFEEDVDLTRFFEVFGALQSKYYLHEGDEFDVEKMIDKAIVGLTKGVGDKHTVYMLPDETKSFTNSLNGELQGIGAELRRAEDIVEVVRVIKGSPAAGVGLLPNDFITKVDTTEISGMPFFDIISMIRGEKGSEVVLTVIRKGVELEFNIIRDKIKIESVTYEMNNGVGVVEINTFGNATHIDFNKVLSEVKEKNPKGLVLDLRYNPGGVLGVSVDMIGQFFDRDELIVSRRSVSFNQEYRNPRDPMFPDIPVVLLVNKGSASASEIFAGAFQDLMRGKVVGDTTYGKGSVQEPFQYSDGYMLKLTTSRWYTPLDRNIDGNGIVPDVEIERTKEDIEEDRDPQLEKALEVVLSSEWRQTELPNVATGSVLVSGTGSVIDGVMTEEVK